MLSVLYTYAIPRSGKSSAVRRVCGISLPEASTLCTRIATLVQMRRSAEPSIRVTLVGPGGKELTVESNVDAKQVKDAVSKAQTRALEESPGKTFVDDHTVCVHVCGPEIPNVTLVDLPGFHTANDTDTKTVNAMVQRYIEMPGTLVLHVVKGDQDYASLLGNDFMRQTGKSKGGEGRVTVLTHCDKLEQSAPGDTQRLQITLDATCENSSLTFAIHGCAQDQAEEDAALRHLSGMDERVEVGAKPLAAHLEERMRVHLATQYPKAVAKLEESLSETIRRLELIKEQTPFEVLFEMSARVQATHQAKRQGLMNELRLTLDQMTRSIKDFNLGPVTGVKSTCQLIDSFDEPIEVGTRVCTTTSLPTPTRRSLSSASPKSTRAKRPSLSSDRHETTRQKREWCWCKRTAPGHSPGSTVRRPPTLAPWPKTSNSWRPIAVSATWFTQTDSLSLHATQRSSVTTTKSQCKRL